MSTAREGATGAKPAERETVVSASYGRAERIGGLLVVVLRDSRMMDELTTLLRYGRDWARAGHPKLAALVVLAPRDLRSGAIFDDNVRSRFTRLAADFQQNLAGHCVVLELDGFIAAIVRSVRSGVMLAVRPTMPMHVCTDLDEGIEWVRKLLPPGAPTRAELRAAIDGLR